MDSQLFQAASVVFGVMVSIIGTLGMLAVRTQQRAQEKHEDRMDKLQEQHNTLANDVAKNYMPRTDVERKLDEIFKLLEDIRKEVRHA